MHWAGVSRTCACQGVTQAPSNPVCRRVALPVLTELQLAAGSGRVSTVVRSRRLSVRRVDS